MRGCIIENVSPRLHSAYNKYLVQISTIRPQEETYYFSILFLLFI